MKKLSGKLFFSFLTTLLIGTTVGFSQGFVNLNFENATFVSDPLSGYYPSAVYASNAISGWTAYVAGSPVADIFSNNVYLSGGCVTIVGTNWIFPRIQGDYFIWLVGDHDSQYLNSAAIGQTAQIPLTARSLTFWGNVGLSDVSFNGQITGLSVIGSTANYNIYGANISAFAGQTGQLLFTTIPGGVDMIDNIQFSDSPIPEPSDISLIGFVLAVYDICRWRHTIKNQLR